MYTHYQVISFRFTSKEYRPFLLLLNINFNIHFQSRSAPHSKWMYVTPFAVWFYCWCLYKLSYNFMYTFLLDEWMFEIFCCQTCFSQLNHLAVFHMMDTMYRNFQEDSIEIQRRWKIEISYGCDVKLIDVCSFPLGITTQLKSFPWNHIHFSNRSFEETDTYHMHFHFLEIV